MQQGQSFAQSTYSYVFYARTQVNQEGTNLASSGGFSSETGQNTSSFANLFGSNSLGADSSSASSSTNYYSGKKAPDFTKTERVENPDEYEMQYSIMRDAQGNRMHPSQPNVEQTSEIGEVASTVGFNDFGSSVTSTNWTEGNQNILGEDTNYTGDEDL